jgi:acyl-CoA thioesterase-2
VSSLADFLDVVQIGPDRFRSSKPSPLSRPTLFGGAVIAQALRAAAKTVQAGLYPHSLHANFLRAGRKGEDIVYQIERIRDGRSFATRSVRVSQGDRGTMAMTVSFHHDEPSPDFQPTRRWIPTPPDDSSRQPPRSDSLGVEFIDLVDSPLGPAATNYLAWVRSAQQLPADRVLQCCVLAYLSDAGAPAVTATAVGIHAGGPDREAGSVMTTSLDHAMWFHRPGRADDWLLIQGTPLSTAGSRGLVLGAIHDRDGAQLASFTQEMLIRG